MSISIEELRKMLSDTSYNSDAAPQVQDPGELADQMQRMRDYQPGNDQDVAAARKAAFYKQGADMTGGSFGPNRQRKEFEDNSGLNGMDGDDPRKADAFRRIREMLGGQ